MTDSCSNGPWLEVWTCPKCYRDHARKVRACDECGVPLKCTIEDLPYAICTVVEGGDDEDAE